MPEPTKSETFEAEAGNLQYCFGGGVCDVHCGEQPAEAAVKQSDWVQLQLQLLSERCSLISEYLKSATRCSGGMGARKGGACALVLIGVSLCCAACAATEDLRGQHAEATAQSIPPC